MHLNDMSELAAGEEPPQDGTEPDLILPSLFMQDTAMLSVAIRMVWP